MPRDGSRSVQTSVAPCKPTPSVEHPTNGGGERSLDFSVSCFTNPKGQKWSKRFFFFGFLWVSWGSLGFLGFLGFFGFLEFLWGSCLHIPTNSLNPKNVLFTVTVINWARPESSQSPARASAAPHTSRSAAP